MAKGLGALTEGFQSGYKFSTTNRRNKLVDKALDHEISGMGERKKAREAGYKRFGQNYNSGHDFQPETYGSRFMGWMKQKLGMGQGGGGAAISPSEMQAPSPMNYEQMASQDPGSIDGGIPTAIEPQRYAHGGSVRHMAKGYADGGKVETNEEKRARYASMIERDENGDPVTSGGGFLEGVEDVARNILPNTQRRFRGSSSAIDAELSRPVSRDRYAADVGSNVRRSGYELLKGTANVARGALEDTGIDSLVKGVGGFLGYGTGRAQAGDDKTAAVQALPTSETPDQAAEAIASQPAPQGRTAAGGIGQTTPGVSTPAAGADTTGVDDDPIVDFSQVREIRPEDMPNKGMKEWEDERNFYAAQAVANGKDPLEAMAAVDAKQMRGFTMYGQQAFQLLRAGNAPAAANALYAAYQYFPNGVDVRFGVMKGKDGRPVIIGMGTDEETGEPTGKPTVITAESLAVQMENMSNPAAFKTWTKDWRTAEASAREYNEITKPAAQSAAAYRSKTGDAVLINAQARLQAAISTSRGGSLKQSDYDRAFSAMNEDTDMMALFETMPAEDADYLKMVMAVSYRNNPGNFPKTAGVIKQAYREGGVAAISEMVSGSSGGP